MDLFIYALSLTIITVTLGNAGNIRRNITIAIALIIATVSITHICSSTTTDEMHDVAVYENTTFTEPKTITIITTSYPWWSINGSDTKWHVKDQQ